MYKIAHNIKENTLQIENSDASVFGKIYLNEGGSLQELVLNGEPLITDLNPLTYKTTYASAILFPFANRIEDGKYRFNNQDFQLKTNHEDERNALHGLVYNKTFKIIQQEIKKQQAKIVLYYKSHGDEAGFPFPFAIELTYIFSRSNLEVKVKVINDGSKSFPFTLGWHPYFYSANLNESDISFNTTKKLNIGHRNITQGIDDFDHKGFISFGHQDYDDCWKLDDKKIRFTTPNSKLELISSQPDGFLQVYTPPKANVVAIEPTTGVSNSFNNNIGLKTLQPKEVFKIKWSLKIHAH